MKTLKKKLVDETITNLNKELNRYALFLVQFYMHQWFSIPNRLCPLISYFFRNMKSILREKLVEKKKEVVPIIEVTG